MPTPADIAAPDPGPGPHQGVIHDLGYRHYDGSRLGRGYITRALFLETTRGAYGLGRKARSKVMPMILLATMCFPALVIAIIASVTNLDELPADYTNYTNNLQLVIMIYIASQAPASVSRDLRFRTMSLYFSRPMQRTDYVAAKFAAMATALFILMALPLTILFFGALLAQMPLTEQVPDYLRAMGGASLVALVLAGFGVVVAALTPRRGLGVAAIIAVLVILIGVQGAVESIAVEQGSDTVASYAGLISPFTLVDGVQHGLLGASSALPVHPPGTLGALVFLGVVVLFVAGCFGTLVLRYRKVSI